MPFQDLPPGLSLSPTAVYEIRVCGECGAHLKGNEVHGAGYNGDHDGNVGTRLLRVVPLDDERLTDRELIKTRREVELLRRQLDGLPEKLEAARLNLAQREPRDPTTPSH